MTKTQTHTDCRTPQGTAVAMIDTIHFLCSELYKKRANLGSRAVQEAIQDLRDNEHVIYILKLLKP